MTTAVRSPALESRCTCEGGNRVEVAFDTHIHIRDSKLSSSPELRVTAPAWKAFVSAGRPGA